MALLEGLLGGANMVQQFGQQQYQNKFNERKLEESARQSDRVFEEGVRQSDRDYKSQQSQFNITNKHNQGVTERAEAAEGRLADEDDRAATIRDNDEYVNLLNVAGYVSADGMSLNHKLINDDIAAGRDSDRFGTAEQIILGFATKYGDLPPGSKATSVEALEGGGYAITVTNADGSTGVVTEDGSSDPNSKVVQFKPGQLGRLANAKFQSEVLTNTSKFNPTIMRGNIKIINSGAEQQGLNDRESDFVEDQAYIKQVFAAAEATGDAGLVRQVNAAIAEGGPAVAELIGKDFNIPRTPKKTAEAAGSTNTDATTDANTDATTNATTDATESVQVATMWSMDNVDRRTEGGRIIRAIEGRAVTKPSPARVEKQRVKLGAYREELVNKIKTSEANRARNKNFQKPSPERDGLLKDKAELAMIDGYLDKDKVAVFTEQVTRPLDKVAGLNGAQIEAGVNDGTIVIPKEIRQLVAAQLERKGIRKIRDLKRLNGVEAAMARAAIIASSEDVNIRKQYATEMVNILDNTENSPNMKRTDEITADGRAADRAYKNKKLGQDARTAYRGWVKEATGEAQKVVAGVNIRYFGENYDEDNLDANTASAVMKSKEMSDFQIYLKNSNLTRGEIKTAVVGLKSVMSTTMAALAGDQTGGPWESILDLIGRDETTDVVDPFDFDASRIIVDDPENPTKIYYTDADGNYTDEDAGLQKLKDLAPSFYENVRAIGIANRRARDKQPAAQG